MLTVTIPGYEAFNSNTNEFITIKETKLQLEHSLISLQKWEQKWHKPFLEKKEKTIEETIDYIRCMTMNPGVDPEIYNYIPGKIIKQITAYIEDPMTATWFSDNTKKGAQSRANEIITAEIIYYWMIALNIPPEYKKWHLNSLLTLIRVVSLKNAPKESMDKAAWAKQRASLNAARRAKYHTNG